MKSIVIRNSDGDHLGFVLCAVPEGHNDGDCVFMIVPQKGELFDAPDTLELFARKDLGESRVHISNNKQSISIRSDGMDNMYIQLDESGTGVWGYDRSDGRQEIGLALIPTK